MCCWLECNPRISSFSSCSSGHECAYRWICAQEPGLLCLSICKSPWSPILCLLPFFFLPLLCRQQEFLGRMYLTFAAFFHSIPLCLSSRLFFLDVSLLRITIDACSRIAQYVSTGPLRDVYRISLCYVWGNLLAFATSLRKAVCIAVPSPPEAFPSVLFERRVLSVSPRRKILLLFHPVRVSQDPEKETSYRKGESLFVLLFIRET